jgi:hypothetical protein
MYVYIIIYDYFMLPGLFSLSFSTVTSRRPGFIASMLVLYYYYYYYYYYYSHNNYYSLNHVCQWDGMGWDGMGCVQVLADPDRRRGYDEGVDIKVKRGRKDEDDDSEEEVR